jgi:acetylornithine deacetylase/succinyl-diaminopimelate desuccinylase-like protein
MWPGVPVLPILMTGATDGAKLTAAGIPTYGIDALFTDADMNHIHGLNEYTSVEYLFKDRDYLYRLVKTYSGS